jgi:CubicO group peptidase (beta-lactamase class C family)
MMLKPSVDSYPHIGLGFQLSNFNFKKTVGHYGGDKGFRSYLMMIPEEKIGLVVLGNCDYQEDFRQEIIHPIAKIMLAKNKSF